MSLSFISRIKNGSDFVCFAADGWLWGENGIFFNRDIDRSLKN